MIESLYIGATGMHAQQLHIDAISNNLANVNTTAFKKSRVSFQDMMYRDITSRQQLDANPNLDAAQSLGSGVGLGLLSKAFESGELKKTDSSMDVAISGNGFLSVVMPDGSQGYTRAGTLQVNRDGLLSNAQGYPLSESLLVPADTKELVIGASGKVYVTVPGEKEQIEIGQIQLTKFVNPAGLLPQGENLYVASEKAGDPSLGIPGEDGYGTLSQGYLEASNVKLVEEMVGLVLAQRAYEVSAKIIQASDEMLSISNNLRR